MNPTELNEDEWKRVYSYNDEIDDQNLENLRKFVIKKKEFNTNNKQSDNSKDA